MSFTSIGVFAPGFPPAKQGGGPIRTLDALVAAAPPSYSVYVFSSDRDFGFRDLLPVPSETWVARGAAEVFYASASTWSGLIRGLGFLRQRHPEVLYFNSFFSFRYTIVPQLLWRVGYWGRSVRLVAPRGEFGANALGRHSTRKKLFQAVYRLLGLHRGLYWHASTELEAADVRRVWGENAQVLVRENETLLPERARDVPPLVDPAAAVRAAFLGRLVELKGLHFALEALGEVRSDVDFDVYGLAEDPEYLERCRRLAEALPQNIRVRFAGPLDPTDTRDSLSGYDLLLSPTAGENFGHVIAESLSVACPVMCSPFTPWNDVLAAGGGWVIDLSAEAWSAAIEEFAHRDARARRQARLKAGRAYEEWRAKPQEPHVFELLDERLRNIP